MGLGVRQPGQPFGGSAVVPALAAIQCGGCGAWHAVQDCPWCGRPHAGGVVPKKPFTVTVQYGAKVVGAGKTTRR